MSDENEDWKELNSGEDEEEDEKESPEDMQACQERLKKKFKAFQYDIADDMTTKADREKITSTIKKVFMKKEISYSLSTIKAFYEGMELCQMAMANTNSIGDAQRTIMPVVIQITKQIMALEGKVKKQADDAIKNLSKSSE